MSNEQLVEQERYFAIKHFAKIKAEAGKRFGFSVDLCGYVAHFHCSYYTFDENIITMHDHQLEIIGKIPIERITELTICTSRYNDKEKPHVIFSIYKGGENK